MKVETTKLNGVFILQPECFQDERGFFLETFNKNQYLEAGINFDFVHHYHNL